VSQVPFKVTIRINKTDRQTERVIKKIVTHLKENGFTIMKVPLTQKTIAMDHHATIEVYEWRTYTDGPECEKYHNPFKMTKEIAEMCYTRSVHITIYTTLNFAEIYTSMIYRLFEGSRLLRRTEIYVDYPWLKEPC
jgi:hypothetical protein